MRAALALALAAVIAAASATATSAGNSFVTKANGICESYYKKLNAIATPTNETPKAVAAYEKRIEPLAISELAVFKEITPPSADAATYSSWLKVTAKETTLARQSITAAESGQAATFARAVTELLAADKTYNALAARMGLKVCAQDTSSTK